MAIVRSVGKDVRGILVAETDFPTVDVPKGGGGSTKPAAVASRSEMYGLMKMGTAAAIQRQAERFADGIEDRKAHILGLNICS